MRKDYLFTKESKVLMDAVNAEITHTSNGKLRMVYPKLMFIDLILSTYFKFGSVVS